MATISDWCQEPSGSLATLPTWIWSGDLIQEGDKNQLADALSRILTKGDTTVAPDSTIPVLKIDYEYEKFCQLHIGVDILLTTTIIWILSQSVSHKRREIQKSFLNSPLLRRR